MTKMKEFCIATLFILIVGQLIAFGAGATGWVPPYGWSTFAGGVVSAPIFAYVSMKTNRRI